MPLFYFLFTFLLVNCSYFVEKQDQPFSPQRSLAIMQAYTTTTETHIVVSSKKTADLQAFLRAKSHKDPFKPQKTWLYEYPGSNWVLHHFEFTNLPSEGPYRLSVLDQRGQVLDQRHLQLFKEGHDELSWAVLSCMRDDLKGIDRIWESLRKARPQAIMMIGDNTYTDLNPRAQVAGVKPERIWQRHMETRNRLPLFRNPRLTPVLSTWDDHDYGINDGGSDFKYKSESQKIFRQFFPMGPMDLGKRGIAQSVIISGQQFLFLDNRSFREANKEGAHFGQTQKAWALEHIKKHPGPSWLLSGDQFFGAHHPFESMAGSHPQAMQQLLSELKSLKAPVAFVSGDRHLSEVMRIPETQLGYVTYEITSSPMHSRVYPGAHTKHPNPLQEAGVDGLWNYVIVDSQVKGQSGVAGRARAYDEEGQSLFVVPINIKKTQ